MTTLVTGGAGRIGKALVKALLDRKEQVRVLAYGEEKVPFENVEVFNGDLTNIDTIKDAVKNVDTIYHLAAVLDYTAPKDLMYKVNVIGTKNLVQLLDKQKLIYLSSTAVYGKRMKENPANEKTPCKPSNFYGRTKLAAEKLILAKNGIVVRSVDVFGSGFTEGYSYVVDGLKDGTLPLVEDGNNFIHWIHINDLIQALLLANDKGKSGEIYLVAGKEVRTVKECFELLCKYLNVNPLIKKVSKFSANVYARLELFKSKFKNRKPKVIPEYIDKIASDRTFDITKAVNELGFKPQVSYDQAAKEMVEEFLKKQQDNVAIKQSGNQS